MYWTGLEFVDLAHQIVNAAVEFSILCEKFGMFHLFW